MNVGIVIGRYRRTGGLERVAVEWARGLHARGHDVTVFAQHADERDEGISFVRVGGPSSPGWLRAARFPYAAARAVRAHPVDVLCAFGAAVTEPAVLGTAGPHRAWFDQGREEAPALSVEGIRRRLNPHHRIVCAIESRIARRATFKRIYATSAAAMDDWARLYGVPPERLGVLENGVNLGEFRFDAAARDRVRASWGVGGDALVVLSIANEISRKGIDTLIRAFPAILAERGDAVLVVGGDASSPAARRLAEAAGVADRVVLAGRIAEPAAAYAAADVFAFPTRYDPWGLVAVEALACGTPVVASRVAGMSGHVRDGETGVILDEPRSPAAVAVAVLKAAAIATPRPQIAASVAHLSWDEILDRVEEILLAETAEAVRR